METKVRFLIVFLVAVFSLVVKWFTLKFVATEQVRKKCRKRFGIYPKIPSFGYFLRRLGWDLANAALGLMALAYVLENSNFRRICAENLGNFDFIFAVVLSFIYVMLYGFAVIRRYITLEAAEKLCQSRHLCGKQWWYASVLFTIGLLMLLKSSWFVVGNG
jgi:hypothetical protein